jgi:hypothetical protein
MQQRLQETQQHVQHRQLPSHQNPLALFQREASSNLAAKSDPGLAAVSAVGGWAMVQLGVLR